MSELETDRQTVSRLERVTRGKLYSLRLNDFALLKLPTPLLSPLALLIVGVVVAPVVVFVVVVDVVVVVADAALCAFILVVVALLSVLTLSFCLLCCFC